MHKTTQSKRMIERDEV